MESRPTIRTLFPAPWTVEQTPSGFVVLANNGRRIAFLYGEDEVTRREILRYPNLSEAHALAKAIAKLPGLVE